MQLVNTVNAETESATPASAVIGSAVPTRRHLQRLRRYEERGRHSKASSFSDLIELDLEVMGYVTLERARWGGTYVTVTAAGRQAIFLDRQRNMAARAVHNTMASRLASWLREQGRFTWENISFIVDLGGGHHKDVRPDVFSIVPTHDIRRVAPMIHEVKTSRADFLADVASPEKRQGYLALAGRVTYVAAAGMLDPGEIPDGCSLLEESEPGRFRKLKTVRAKRVELSSWALLNLVIKSKGSEA